LGLWPGFVDDIVDQVEGCVSDLGGCASNVGAAAVETLEAGSFGIYVVNHEVLSVLGYLPDPVEVLLIDHEVVLTGNELLSLGFSTFFDYLLGQDITNVNVDPKTGEKIPTSWWPSSLENLLGGNSEDTNCWPSLATLSGTLRFAHPYGLR